MSKNKYMKYPNLVSLVYWHSYGTPTFADHAGVTRELFQAVLEGDEELTDGELLGISRLVHIPLGLLKCPKMQYLYVERFQHSRKIIDLAERYNRIRKLRCKIGKGNCTDLKLAYQAVSDIVKDFDKNGKVSYCRYRAALERVTWNEWLYRNSDKKKVRGLQKQTKAF